MLPKLVKLPSSEIPLNDLITLCELKNYSQQNSTDPSKDKHPSFG
jgi:hypothetical protein